MEIQVLKKEKDEKEIEASAGRMEEALIFMSSLATDCLDLVACLKVAPQFACCL